MKNKTIMTFAFMTITAMAFGQGSLTPPGTPSPTMKTLAELDSAILQVDYAVTEVDSRIDLATVISAGGYEHYINTPGSYYLSENITIDATSGIYISVSGVTLDLNGFEINRGSGSGSYGIYVQSGTMGVRIFNGIIRRCSKGVHSEGSDGTYTDLVVSECSVYGIYGSGANEIRSCRFLNNYRDGIDTGSGSSVRDCWVEESGETGMEVGPGSSVSDCVVRHSGEWGIVGGYDGSFLRCVVTGSGYSGFHLSTDSSVESCVSKDNVGTGFGIGGGSSLATCTSTGNNTGVYSTGDGVNLIGCVVQNNAGYGIYLQNYTSVKNCIASGNFGAYGIYAGSHSLVVGCSASYNESSLSSSYGIGVGVGSTVQKCVVWGNDNTFSPAGQTTGAGIYAAEGSLVKDCSVCQNKGAGIRATGSCQVIGNQCDQNGLYAEGTGAGIEALGGSNRIAGNLLTDNDFGLLIQSSTNLVVNNAAGGNGTEFSISGTQIKGTIVTDTGIISEDDSLANFNF